VERAALRLATPLGTWHIMTPRLKKFGGHVPRAPHQIAPMHHSVVSEVCIEVYQEHSRFVGRNPSRASVVSS